jgi:hypothetical protein
MFSRNTQFYADKGWANCDKRAKLPISTLYDGITIFPNDQIVQRHMWDMSPQDIKDLRDKTAATTKLSVCVDYVTGDRRHHQTRQLYELDKRGTNNEPTFLDPQEGDVTIGNLYFATNPDINGDAF